MLRFQPLKKWSLTMAAGCAALMALAAPAAHASAWDKKTTVNFSRPVEVPGAVLPPGKYVMKLVDIASARNIVQITNERENHVFSTSFTIPVYRSEPAEQTLLAFYEAPAGQPEALKTWYYPGDELGRQFVYPKGWGIQLASVSGQNVPTGPITDRTQGPLNVSGDNAANNAPPAAVPTSESTPSAAPVTVAQAAPVEVASADPEPQAQQPASGDAATSSGNSSTTETTLPKTASPLPSFALLGMLAIGGALGLRRFRHRLS